MKIQNLKTLTEKGSRVGGLFYKIFTILALIVAVAAMPLTARAVGNAIGWGNNNYGQTDFPALPSGVKYTQIAAEGDNFSLALRSDGQVVGFGYNGWGNLNAPVLPDGVVYTQIDTGNYYSLALRSDGQVVGFGYAGDNAGYYGSDLIAPPLPEGMTYTQVAAGNGYSFALRSDGQIVPFLDSATFAAAQVQRQIDHDNYANQPEPWWWTYYGYNNYYGAWADYQAGQANSSYPPLTVPAIYTVPSLPDGVTYTKVSCAFTSAVALRSDGQIVCWGDDQGNMHNPPALPEGATSFTKIAAGQYENVALTNDGRILAWGPDYGYGNLYPPALPNGVVFTDIAAGYLATYGLRSDGQISFFGYNNGQATIPVVSGAAYTAVVGAQSRALGLLHFYVNLALSGDSNYYIVVGNAFTDPGASATDDHGNVLQVTVTGSVDTNTPGTYVLTYSAVDANGNHASDRRVIHVVKKLPSALWAAAMPSFTQSTSYANAAINEPITVWGRAWNGTAPYSYALDFGDGSPLAYGSNLSAQDARFMGQDHTYTTGGSKTMTLTITDSASHTEVRTAVIRVLGAPVHNERINMAIEKGLIYLYKTQTDLDADRIYWNQEGWNSEHSAGYTGAPMMAFEENGHIPSHDYEEDIYAETLQKGLNFLFDHTQGAVTTLSVHSDGIADRDSDSNGNGKGAYISSNTYASGWGALAVIFSQPNVTSAHNTYVDRGPFNGMSYFDLVTDILDQYAWSQGDGGLRGAYEYHINGQQQGRYDGSTMQWPTLTVKAAKDRWGINMPQWYKDNAVFGYKTIQNPDNGGVGYDGAYNWNNTAKTGGLIIANSNAGIGLENADVAHALQFLGNNFYTFGDPGWGNDFYAMYALKKGLSVAGVTQLTTPTGNVDWYQNVSAWLLGNASLVDPNLYAGYRSTSYGFGQNADGSWNGTGSWISTGHFSTAHAVLVLTQSLTIALPVAVIAPVDVQSARSPSAFTLNGSNSYHLDPNFSVVEWLWILDAGANPDWTHPTASGQTALVNPGWNTPGNHTVTLRVKDNQDPPQYATATANISVTESDVPPVAYPIPPTRVPQIYTAKIGDTIPLDGRSSTDVDGDPIVYYAWDLDGNNTYGDAADAALDTSGNHAVGSTASITFSTAYTGVIGLKVGSQPHGDVPVVYSSNQTTVDIYASPNDLSVVSISASHRTATSADVHAVVMNSANSGTPLNNVLVRFYNGNPYETGAQIGGNYLVNLPIGASANVDVTGLPLTAETQFVFVKVDAANTVPESDESNNTGSVAVPYRISGDNTPPVINQPASPLIVEATSASGAVVNYTVTATDETDGNIGATASPVSGSTFALGDTTVNTSATDAAGNTANSSFTVRVQDTTAPVFSPSPADTTVKSNAAGTATLPNYALLATATDAVGVVSITQSPAPGSSYVVGDVVSVTLTATDAAANQGTAMFNVTVLQGNRPPVLTDDRALVYNEATLIDVLANDTDADSDSLTITSVTQPASGGAVSIQGNKVLFTPNASFSRPVPFTYTATDGVFSSTANVTIYHTPNAATTFCALLSDSNGKPRGYFRFDMIPGGLGTGTLIRDGVTRTNFKGNLVGAQVTIPVQGNKPSIPVAYPMIDVDSASNPVLGISLLSAQGERLTGVAKVSPYDKTHAYPQTGSYTLAVTGANSQIAAVLQGAISKRGDVRLSGKLGNFASASFSGKVLANGQTPVYFGKVFHTKVNALGGTLTVASGAAPQIAGTLHWKLPAGDRNIPAGVEGDFTATGAKYTKSATRTAMLSFNAAKTATLDMKISNGAPATQTITIGAATTTPAPNIKLHPSCGFFEIAPFNYGTQSSSLYGVVLQGSGLNYGVGIIRGQKSIGSLQITPKP